MQRGGRREGAGNKKGNIWASTKLKLEMRKALVERAHREMNALYDAQFALALGHWRVIDDPVTGQPIRVYKKGPNGEALGYLLDQVMDKAIQRVDMQGELNAEISIPKETADAIRKAMTYAFSATPETKKPTKPRARG